MPGNQLRTDGAEGVGEGGVAQPQLVHLLRRGLHFPLGHVLDDGTHGDDLAGAVAQNSVAEQGEQGVAHHLEWVETRTTSAVISSGTAPSRE